MKAFMCIVLPFSYITPKQIEKMKDSGLEIRIDGDKQLVSACGFVDSPIVPTENEDENW